jgi:hypothetical protein
MKTKFIAVLSAIALFTSCQKDVIPELTQNTSTTSNRIVTNELATNCKACEYYPICAGSVYNYSANGGSLFISTTIGKPSSYTVEFISDTSINGDMYKKMKVANGQVAMYDCTDGVTTELVPFINPTNQTGGIIKTTILKANEPVGAIWRDTLSLSNTLNEFYEYTILEKGTSRAVAGVIYDDIIKLKKNTFIQNNGVTTLTNDYLLLYYARRFGLIETKSINTVGQGAINYHSILTSAIIPQ